MTKDLIELKLTVSELNQVLNSLANLPYIQVFSLIQKIQNVAQETLGEDTKEPTTAA